MSLGPGPKPEALLCALVLVPSTYARNRFFELFERAEGARIRRRASRLRGIVRQLLGDGRAKAEVVGEAVLDDGQVLLKFRVPELSFVRTTALSALEAATVRYALHRAGQGKLDADDRRRVEEALHGLDQDPQL